MHPYGVRDVERLLRLPRSTIRTLIAAGFVKPERGPRNAWRFSFQDLIVLRTAQALADARVPHRRITRSVKELRRHLPESMPLSGLSIGAVGDRVVVREGETRWQAESGQYLLAFEGDPSEGSLKVIAQAPALSQDEDAYRRAIAEDPSRLDARINLGLLLHEAGRLEDAEREYRGAIALQGDDALAHFNLGVVLEDLGRIEEAARSYAEAIRLDPELADGHYNLALLYKALGKPREALRHMSQYRRLTAGTKR
ncbi:MAG: tetratricopeptide repeat protein [Usitatibacter sp.]